MRIIDGDSVTIIYPFAGDGEEPVNQTAQVMIFPDGGVKLWLARTLMDAERAKMLAMALLHAAEMSQNRRGNDQQNRGKE